MITKAYSHATAKLGFKSFLCLCFVTHVAYNKTKIVLHDRQLPLDP